jgi:hypothetical protein
MTPNMLDDAISFSAFPKNVVTTLLVVASYESLSFRISLPSFLI